ncbi:uncharacterized protein LOC116848114 isoform X2 [Odontomachus brunneus]|uniref:uncharacterized protein LOC116848114 isoform X2 n=1 Tax=Odontomachus brunneus TaxID=486640 RepID=UPI0013F28C10|nr:uncharacterized protein LOC116848114 isoform X2 [Odontomachus brunneus]
MNRTAINVSRTDRSMHTSRTPRVRARQRFDLTTRSEEDEEINISGLDDLVDQTWNICAVSALFGFQHDDVSLKLYSKKLREEVAKRLSHEDLTYNANFSIMENITSRTSHENYSAIKIEVLAKTSEHDKEKSIYKGILLSWRTTQIQPDTKNSTRLPLLLCRGTRNFNKDEEPIISGEVHMEYTVPELPVTDTIKVKFDISELRKILTSIVDQDNNMINTILDLKHIEQFYEVLHTQMLTIGGIQLGLCTLHRINLPGITIMENRMKIMDVEIMNRTLLYLYEKAFDMFHTLHIDI